MFSHMLIREGAGMRGQFIPAALIWLCGVILLPVVGFAQDTKMAAVTVSKVDKGQNMFEARTSGGKPQSFIVTNETQFVGESLNKLGDLKVGSFVGVKFRTAGEGKIAIALEVLPTGEVPPPRQIHLPISPTPTPK